MTLDLIETQRPCEIFAVNIIYLFRDSCCFCGPGQDSRLDRRIPTQTSELRHHQLSINILLSIINFSLETARPPGYLDGRLKVTPKKREKETPLRVSRKKAEKKNPFLDLAGSDLERRRRSVDLYRRTQEECYACDAETQTKKKKKSQCRIC